MIRLRHKVLIHSMRVIDQLILAATCGFVLHFRPDVWTRVPEMPVPHFSRVGDTIAIFALALGWIVIYTHCIRYRSDRFVNLADQTKDLTKASILAAFWLLIISVVFSVGSITPVNVVMFWAVVALLGLTARLILRMIVLGARRSGYNCRYLIIVGTGERALEMATRIEHSPELGFRLVGFVAEDPERLAAGPPKPGERLLGTIDELQAILERERVDEVMACLPLARGFDRIAPIITKARELGIVLRLVPDAREGELLHELRVEEFGNDYVVTMFREELLFQLLVKRLSDIFLSSTALIALSPLMLIVAVLVKLTSPGPVLFRQDRVGMNQRRFRLYKFRSMVADAETRRDELAALNELDGPAFKIREDPRVTPVGRLLRKTSLDELPQLFNVLRGEMSLVGPRPPLPAEVARYHWNFRRRLSVKPGLTCVWQVNGRSMTTFDQWMEMDREYIENWSFWLDLKILFKTVPAVLFGRGAH